MNGIPKNMRPILEELYAIDGTLRRHEKELVQLISELLVSKPDTKFDKEFAYRLREELMGRAPKPAWYSFIMTRPLVYSLSSLAVLLLVVVSVVLNSKKNDGELAFVGDKRQNFEIRQETKAVGERAFGTLKAEAPSKNNAAETDTKQTPETTSGPQQSQPPSLKAEGSGVGGGGTPIDSPLIYPEFVQYRFVYKGEPAQLKDDKGEVLKRTKGLESSKQLVSFLEGAKVLADFGSFENLKLRLLEVVEDKDGGYVINVNFDEGSVWINQNWDRVRILKTEEAKDSPEIKDPEIISIANEFLKSHNINTSLYGEPIVERPQYAIMSGEARPEIWPGFRDVIVRYPLLLSGKKAYDEGGNPYGLEVGINPSEKRVSRVGNLTSQVYESSLYELETDFKKILEYAKRGSVYGYFEGSERIVEIELEAPQRVLLRHWQSGDELLVPALLFKIKNRPERYYGSNAVVIPLVKDLLKAQVIPSKIEPGVGSGESSAGAPAPQ